MASFDDSFDLAEGPQLSRDVGALLDLGLALGHQRFKVVSLAGHGPDEADSRDSRSAEYSDVDMVMSKEAPDRDPYFHQRYHGAIRESNLCVEQELQELQELRNRTRALSRELKQAKRDSVRLETEIQARRRSYMRNDMKNGLSGRERVMTRIERRRAEHAVLEAKALREKLTQLEEQSKRATRPPPGLESYGMKDCRAFDRVSESRRRQQAESLMQAYKELYEDQLREQGAFSSSPTSRNLRHGFTTLSNMRTSPTRRESCFTLESLSRASGNGGNKSRLASEASIDTPSSVRDKSMTTGQDGKSIDNTTNGAGNAGVVATAAVVVDTAAGALAIAAASEDLGEAEVSEGENTIRCREKTCDKPVEGYRMGTAENDSRATTPACTPPGESQVQVLDMVEGSRPGNVEAATDQSPQPQVAYPRTRRAAAQLNKEALVGDASGTYTSSEGLWGRRRSLSEDETYSFPRDVGIDEGRPRPAFERQSYAGGSSDLDESAGDCPVAQPPCSVGNGPHGSRGLSLSASWPEAVHAPKRSDSPSRSTSHRWRSTGKARAWGGRSGDQYTRIEPSRVEVHNN